jgi:hypothetical protein
MFGNLVVSIESEDVENDLLAGSGKVVDGLLQMLLITKAR